MLLSTLRGWTLATMIPHLFIPVAPFSLAAHVPALPAPNPEMGVKSFKGSVPFKGGWYEAFITHPHDSNFWAELEALLRTLAPGFSYGILLQPQFENGARKTLGTSFTTSNDPSMELLTKHFEPIIIKSEAEYNEEFVTDTRVKMLNLGPIVAPTSSSKSLKTTPTIKAIETMTQSILLSNAQILEAIKVQAAASPQVSPAPTIPWVEIGKGIATAVAPFLGASISFNQATPVATAPTPPSLIRLKGCQKFIKLEKIKGLIQLGKEVRGSLR